jgi:hypothetical protein
MTMYTDISLYIYILYTDMLVQLQYDTNIGVYLNFRKCVSYLAILKAS